MKIALKLNIEDEIYFDDEFIDETNENYKSYNENEISEDEFIKLNKEGYNIYKCLNEFHGKRRIKKQIKELHHILIDYDNTTKIELDEKINAIKRKFEIYPTRIIRTFKGYHCIYKIADELKTLDLGQYERLAGYLNKFIGGDYRAIQVTGMYKLPGYLDNKDNRLFLITEEKQKYKKEYVITKETIKSILKEDVILDTSFNKAKSTKDNYEIFTHSLNNISFAHGIIPALKEYGVNISITVDKSIKINGEVKYDGLKYNTEGDYINDFTHGKTTGENRANGNHNFLLNIIFNKDRFKFFEFCNKYLNLKTIGKNKLHLPITLVKALNQKTDDFGLYVSSEEELSVLKNNGGINFLEIKTDKDIETLQDLLKGDFDFEFNKNKLNELVNNNSLSHVIYGINHYIRKNKLEYFYNTDTQKGEYQIEINKLLSFLGLAISNKNRKNLFELLLKVSCISINKSITRNINGVSREGVEFVKIIDIRGFLPETNNGEMVLLLDIMKADGFGTIAVSEDVLSINATPFGNNNNKLKTTFVIVELLENMKAINGGIKHFRLSTLIRELGINYSRERENKKYVVDFLTELKEKKIISNFRLLTKKEYGEVFEIMDISYKKNKKKE